MGRDWSWLSGGRGKKKKSSKKDIKTPPPPLSPPPAGNTSTAAGCMSAVFNIFDLQHLQFPLNHHHLHLPKGVDAPRNSLESTEETEEKEEEETSSSPIRKDGNLNLSIKTKPQARRSSLSSSSSLTATESYSPSVKTPTLVARLMGLDLVPPDNYRPSSSSPSSYVRELKTPTFSQTNKHRHYFLQRNSIDGGTRSLPETPRISLGRRSVDVNCYEHQRSSLHLKDNNNNNNNKNVKVLSERESCNNIRLMKVKEMKIHEDKENRSPRDYAKQIVMQLKENVSRRRRMGTDITNREQQQQQRPREIHHESKKASKITIITHDSSSSPKTKLTSSSQRHNVETTAKKVQDKTKLQTLQEEPQGTEQRGEEKERYQKQRKFTKKCKKTESFKSEPFVRSSPTSSNNNNNNNGLLHIQGDKKTPISINDLISFTTVPSLHTNKKKDSSHHKSSNFHVDTLKLRETQSPRNRASEFSRFQSQSQQTHIASFTGGELEYITRIFRRTGVDRDTPISYAKWFSPSHPLDPSIFYFLEHFVGNSSESLSLRSERKLLFHLVDEILADILKPHINLKPWVCRYSIQSRRNLKGSELIDEVNRRIGEFPSAECLVLEDIDALVAGDLPETATDSAFEEEGERIVTEVERGIFETLVNETTTVCYDTWIKTTSCKSEDDDDVSGTWGVHVRKHSSKAGSHHDVH